MHAEFQLDCFLFEAAALALFDSLCGGNLDLQVEIINAADVDRNAKWKLSSAKWRKELGVTQEYSPYTQKIKGEGSLGLLGLGEKPPKRTLDLIDCCVLQVCKKARKAVHHADDLLKNHMVDVSQNHDRRPLSSPPAARALTTSSKLYIFDQKRLLTPEEHLLLQGYNETAVVRPKGVSGSDLRRMAGEGIALPCLGTIIWALFLTKKFHK